MSEELTAALVRGTLTELRKALVKPPPTLEGEAAKRQRRLRRLIEGCVDRLDRAAAREARAQRRRLKAQDEQDAAQRGRHLCRAQEHDIRRAQHEKVAREHLNAARQLAELIERMTVGSGSVH